MSNDTVTVDRRELLDHEERERKFKGGIVLVPVSKSFGAAKEPKVYDADDVWSSMTVEQLNREIAKATNRLSALVAARDWLAQTAPVKKAKRK